MWRFIMKPCSKGLAIHMVRPNTYICLRHQDTVTQGKHDEAELLFERSQAIREKALGREHPDVATSLNNRASLMELQARRFRT